MIRTTLDTLRPGQNCVVDGITTPIPHLRQRLMEMGLIRGTRIEMIRFAPTGDPVEVQVEGFRLSLRKADAEAIVVAREGV